LPIRCCRTFCWKKPEHTCSIFIMISTNLVAHSDFTISLLFVDDVTGTTFHK
jgi:hypothetical protein